MPYIQLEKKESGSSATRPLKSKETENKPEITKDGSNSKQKFMIKRSRKKSELMDIKRVHSPQSFLTNLSTTFVGGQSSTKNTSINTIGIAVT